MNEAPREDEGAAEDAAARLASAQMAVSAALAIGEVLEDQLTPMLGSDAMPQQLDQRGMQAFKTTYAKWNGIWRAWRVNARNRSVPAHQLDRAVRAAGEFSDSLSALSTLSKSTVSSSPSPLADADVVLVNDNIEQVHGTWAHRLEDRQPVGPIYNEVRSALAALTAARARIQLLRSRASQPSAAIDEPIDEPTDE